MARPLDEWQQLVAEALSHERTMQWTLAALAYEGAIPPPEGLGLTPKEMAGPLQCSASRVRRLIQVWRAFPDPAQRPPTLYFEHFVVAVATADPQGWVDTAADREWSVAQLRDAIRALKAADPDEVRRTTVERRWRAWCNAYEAADPQTQASMRQQVADWLAAHPVARRPVA
ncbi:MAG: hypothetical protein K6V97_04030 [Actinomycetia bacterium]|nr:hypothetical protein [Actinomycetes bacterium]